MKFDKQFSDEGVSPVVGVILMVAITVILSAIIATFVLDLGGTVSQNPQAGVTFDQSVDDVDGDGTDETFVTVQVVSMENADQVGVSTDANSYSATMKSVGDSVRVGDNTDQSGGTISESNTFAGLSNNDKITVTGTLEGKTAVIQTYTVDA